MKTRVVGRGGGDERTRSQGKGKSSPAGSTRAARHRSIDRAWKAPTHLHVGEDRGVVVGVHEVLVVERRDAVHDALVVGVVFWDGWVGSNAAPSVRLAKPPSSNASQQGTTNDPLLPPPKKTPPQTHTPLSYSHAPHNTHNTPPRIRIHERTHIGLGLLEHGPVPLPQPVLSGHLLVLFSAIVDRIDGGGV